MALVCVSLLLTHSDSPYDNTSHGSTSNIIC